MELQSRCSFVCVSILFSFVVNWPGSKKQAQVSIIKHAEVCDSVSGQSEAFTPIACFDCRGLDIFEFTPEVEFEVIGVSGAKFEDVKLSEDGDWYDFDENSNQSIGIEKLEYQFRVVK